MAVVVKYQDVQKEIRIAEEELSKVVENIHDLEKLIEAKTAFWGTQINSGYTVKLNTSVLLNLHNERKEQIELRIKELKEVDEFLTKAIQAFK